MKKIIIFLVFLLLISCNNIIKKRQVIAEFNCPTVFFSAEDNIYIDNTTSIEEVQIKAELNNFVISKKCTQKENLAIIPLDILIIAKPMNNLEESSLSFPIYISLLDSNDAILETHYFSVLGSMNKNTETNNFIESEVTDRLKIVTKYLDTSQLVLGFMLDNEKRKLLN